MAGVATAVALFGMVAVQSLVGQTQMETTKIQRRVDQKKDALEALDLQVASLASLDRVAARAAAMGLVVPPAIVFLPAPGEDRLGAGALPSFDGASGSDAGSDDAVDETSDPSSASAPRGPARSGATTSPDAGGR